MKKKWWYGLATAVVVGAFALLPFGAKADGEGVSIEDIFKDTGLRAYVSASYDKDGDGYLSDVELSAVEDIYVDGLDGWDVHDLSGVEVFPNLRVIDCSNNSLVNIDVTGCKALVELICRNCNLTSMNVTGCSNLKYLTATGNMLSSLDLTGCNELYSLTVRDNHFSSLDLSEVPKLAGLDCTKNQITELNIANNTSLVNCWIGYNERKKDSDGIEYTNYRESEKYDMYPSIKTDLTTKLVTGGSGVQINETNFPNYVFRYMCVYKEFDLDKNGFLSQDEIESATELNAAGCYYLHPITYDEIRCSNLKGLRFLTSLKTLDCSNCELDELDISNNRMLEELRCNNNNLTSLDVSHNPNLQMLVCEHNELTKLDVSSNSNLYLLQCDNNKLVELNLNGAEAMLHLYCSYNKLVSMDLSANHLLINVDCSYNKLTSINLKGADELSLLNCQYNELSQLDVSENKGLGCLRCQKNHLVSLNIKGVGLRQLTCYANRLPYVDISSNEVLRNTIQVCPKQNKEMMIDSINYKIIYYDGKPDNVYSCIYVDDFSKIITDSSKVPCVNHTWDAGKVTKAATCTKTGVKTFTCKNCSETKTEIIKATGHKEVKDPAVAATFTRKGKTAGSHCSVCGTVIKKQTVIAMKTGLNKVSGKTYFYKDGKKQSGWQSVGNKKYYFDKKTKVMVTGKVKIGKKYYFFDKKTGVMKTGKIKVGKKYYYFSPAKKTLGQMQTGWVKIGKKKYYFSPKKKTLGQMVTGKLKIGKKTYKFNKKGVCLNP